MNYCNMNNVVISVNDVIVDNPPCVVPPGEGMNSKDQEFQEYAVDKSRYINKFTAGINFSYLSNQLWQCFVKYKRRLTRGRNSTIDV